MSRAVFLDRDGTLNVERHYLHDPAALEIIPGTGPALRRLLDAGFELIIVTNQSGIGRGYYTESDMQAVNEKLATELATDGVEFLKVYYAPEAPDQNGAGRKPSPKFLHDAVMEFGIDLKQSFMVGDKLADLQCGWNAGVKKSILVRTGYGAELEKSESEVVMKAVVVDDITEAVDWILTKS